MPDQEQLDIRGQAEACVRQGDAKLEQKDYCGAIADYDLAIAVDPDYVEGYRKRARYKRLIGLFPTLIGDGDIRSGAYLTGAIADFTMAIELDPNDGSTYLQRGNAKIESRDYAGAIADYDLALNLDYGGATA